MRNSTGAVVQFLYGEDGMDGTAIESQRVEHLRMDAQRFRVRAPPPTLTLTLLMQASNCEPGESLASGCSALLEAAREFEFSANAYTTCK